MTLGYASFTLGVIFIYTSLRNMSVADLALGRPGPGQPAPIVDTSGGSSGGGPAGTAGGNDVGPMGKPSSKVGVGTFDGKQVALWMIPYLKKARATGLWKGQVTSGYRDPAYSEKLCYQMCGAPSCEGTCAGRSSNHSGKVYPNGAVDVSDPSGFAAAMKKIHGPLKNSLPSDPVHFSIAGN